MTLILNYSTQESVFQVSDRRLSRLDGAVVDVVEDDANKATIYCGQVMIGYTGFAQTKTQRTDEWLTSLLTKAQSLHGAFELIRSEAEGYFRSTAYTPRQRRHAFAGAGWARIVPAKPLQAFLALVSNFHDDADLRELTEARREFTYRVYARNPEKPQLTSIGARLTQIEADWLLTELENQTEPSDIAKILATAIRVVADRDNTVGRGILAAHISRTAAENARSSRDSMILAGSPRLEPDVPSSLYFAADSESPIVRMPNLVCNKMALMNVNVSPL